jgi:cytoskeletal protein RodZ
MSSPHPPRRRRHSSRVYRRRRALVLLVLVIVVVVAWVTIANAMNGSKKPISSSTSTTSSTSAPKATTSSTPGPSTATSGAAAPCDPRKIAVTPMVDANSFESGQLPNFQIGITNTAKEACTFNVGTSQMSMTVTSGNETYWKSSDCQAESSDTEALLLPGKMEVSAPFQWSREYSSPDTCEGGRESVPTGGASYYLNVQVGAAKSTSGYQFLLY